ncbi:Cupredoxin, partial [Obelidium mucronatum]
MDQAIYFKFTVIPDPESKQTNTTGTISTVTLFADSNNFYDSQYLVPSQRPTLEAVLKGKESDIPKSSNALVIRENTWVMLQVRNSDNIEHVFHLHGHTFYVLKHGKLLHKRAVVDSITTYPRRDSIQVPMCSGGLGGTGEAGCIPGYVNLLVHFNHPGVWLFHCHVEWHMATGLAMTFVNTAGLERVSAQIPGDWFDGCAALTS